MKYPTAWACGIASQFQLWGDRRGVWDQRGPHTRRGLAATRAQRAGTALAGAMCGVHCVFYGNDHYFHLSSGISDNIQLNGICRGKKKMPQTMSPFKYQLKVCACEVEFHKPHCYKQRGNVANRGWEGCRGHYCALLRIILAPFFYFLFFSVLIFMPETWKHYLIHPITLSDGVAFSQGSGGR